MTTTPQPAPLIVLQPLAPVSDERNLLAAPTDAPDSCCGGGSCSI